MAPKKSAARTYSVSQCFDEMIFERTSTLSPHTISDYIVTGRKVLLHFGRDPILADLTRENWIGFFNWLRDEHISTPDGAAPRPARKLKDKTRRNIHTNLSALYTWAVKAGRVPDNLIRTIDRPPKSDPDIDPLTHDEIGALLSACEHTARWATSNTVSERHTALRDKLIIMLLLDTGLRAQELCDIQIQHLSLARRTILIPQGKGGKSRSVHFGKRTERLIWEYLEPRKTKPTDCLFLVDDSNPRPMTRHTLRRLVVRLGERAGVKNVHPHRFRHTFATEYLRNGGQMLALKDLLGHADFEMVEHYAHFVQADVKRDHEIASPVDNWKL